MKTSFIILCFGLISVCSTFAQIGYQKDSLQIKVYTEIEYINNNVKNIKVDTLFCDYCSTNQTKMIKEEALRRTYLARNDKGIRLVNGKYRHALYIRISKKDFLEMNEDEENKNEN
jgi:hypothetical protein